MGKETDCVLLGGLRQSRNIPRRSAKSMRNIAIPGCPKPIVRDVTGKMIKLIPVASAKAIKKLVKRRLGR